MAKKQSRSTRIICKIISSKVGIPSYLVLYLNALVSLLILSTPWLFSPGAVPPAFTPWGQTLWPSLLLIACIAAVHGLLTKNPHVVALGAFAGFLLWFLDFFSYLLSALFLADTLSLLFSVPMMLYFAYIYLRHSFYDLYLKEHHATSQTQADESTAEPEVNSG